MKSLAAAAALVALAAPTASAQMPQERDESLTFEAVLNRAGLGHLTDEDKERVQALLLGLNNATTSESKEKAGAFDSVVGYLREQGFAPELVMTGIRDGQPILIIGRILRAFTTDIPATLTAGEWENGVYFVQWTDDGATAMIVDGVVHDFTKSSWRLF